MTNWGRGRPSLTSSENTPCSRYMFVMLFNFDAIASELFRTTLTSWTTAGRWCSSWWRSTGLPGEPTTSPGAWTSEKIKKIWPQTPWLWTNKWNVWTYIKYPRIGCTSVCMNNCANMAGKCPKKIERRDICHSLAINLPVMNGEVQLRCIKTNTDAGSTALFKYPRLFKYTISWTPNIHLIEALPDDEQGWTLIGCCQKVPNSVLSLNVYKD